MRITFHARRSSLIAVWLLCTSVPAFSAGYRVRVDAGKSDRRDTPVFVDLTLPAGTSDLSAKVTGDDGTAPAQVEPLDDGKSRLWWILEKLPTGHTTVCTLHVGDRRGADRWPVFTWKDSSGPHGKSMDLLYGDRPVLRYMYTPFDPTDIERTKKPFHQLFDPDGSRLITKGAGGLYPHHRGIFFGYRKCTVDGGNYDTWHAANGEHQVHKRVVREITGPVLGGHVVEIAWNDREPRPFIVETRRVVCYRQSRDHLLIEFSSTLRPVQGPVSLSGDRQHAGVQFRAAQEVADNAKATRYLRPARWKELPADKEENGPDYKDLPWDAIQYKLGDRAYTVAYLTDPANPDGAAFSERLYGRFGEYFPWELSKDHPLEVRYRWWVAAAGNVTRDDVRDRYDDLAQPPVVRLMPAEAK